ncbi:hypothetical protein J4209_07180, partial [Candidatus Woesearchaeota archaeon]|nr:hypothetical protein [Candidatus Woesearchaeota archaeon]
MKKALWQIIALFCIELVVLLPVYMVNALTISNIKVGVSGDGAQINWTTNDYSTSFVNYGNDTNLGLTVFMNAFVKEHSLNINSLESMKQYFFEVMSQNLSGYSATDNNGGNYYTFTTLDIIPPDKVDGVEASGITMNSLTLKWNQSGESDFGKYIIYRNLANIANTTTTSYFDGNLSADTQYTYRVSAVDNMGNEGSESSPLTIRTVAPDLTKPSLTSVAVVELADTSAKISWVTNENATSSVYFGNSSDLGNEQVSSSLITNHTISISNLIKNVEYYYLVGSCDASNNCDNSSQQSFIAGTDTTLPTIDVSIPSHFNSRRMDIGGKTEPRSTVRVYIDNNLERQLSSNYIGDSGEFFFYDVYVGEDETTHTIKIWARDFIGNIYEREFEVLIDLNYPVLTINPIPETISEESITISGTVNEQSTIKFYTAYGANDLNPPLKIAGLANESVSTNSVKIKWNESTDSDFYQYIIYREDVGAIATTSSAGYTTYTDVLVNTNTSYTYSVSALDASGNEGFKSEALTVKTLEGGRTNITPPDVVNITNVFSPVVINSSGEFSESIELDQGDGVYQIVIEAVDVAGNDVKIYNQTLVDTRPPEIANITPKTGSYIYEIYADEVDIEGDVEPDVTVKLYLNKSNVDLEDYSTITDMFGHFKFDDIDLTKAIGVDFEPREVSPSDFDNQYFRARSDEPYWPVRLDFVATDKLGKQGNATVRYQIRTCWSGNFTYDTVPLTEYQSPTFLSTERLAEGSEAIYFFLNFSYHGIGTNDAIESISISKACDYYIANDPQYNYSCRIMPSSCTYKSTEDNKALYVTCPLGSIDEMNKWLEDDWKGFFDAINNEMIFPFSIKIRYKHDVEGKTVRGDQRMCEEIVYDVDASKINFKDVLPDWLLYNLVDWLDSSIESLEKVMESVKDVLKIVGIGCVGSIVIKFILTFSRRFTCYYDGFQDRFSEDADKRCPIREEERNKLSNSELKEKCESCYNAWETEEKFYMIYRGLCDRVFCHTAPAAWTADVSSPELREKKILESRQCGADDQAQQGQPLIEVKCSGFDKGDINMDAVNADNKCYRATVAKGTNNKDTKSLVFVKSKDQKTADTANNVYKFTTVSATSTTVGFVDNIFTRKYSDKYYTARSENCKEYCARYDGWGCGPAQSCIDINFDEKKAAGTTIPINRQDAWTNLDPKPLKSNKLLSYDGVDVNGKDVTYSATRAGLTADCIFGNEGDNAMTKTPLITTDDMKIAEECCCISESGEVDSGKYYSAADTSKQGKPAFEADEITEADYPKFSYRYYKIKFETSTGSNQYDPDRYVEGRDKPGCFGQQKVWFMPDKLQHDPFTNHISTFQCGCISGIYHRLEVIRNLMTYMSNCLITVRETGTADSGACKELFSQYVCSLFWRLIVFFREGCLPWGQGIDLKMSENRAAALFGGGVDALWGGVAETQAELTEEYGNAQLTNFLGIGEEALAKKVCMAAFGYDWGFDLDNIIDAAYATPYATLVLPVNPTREYLTFDPTNGYATYEYRAAWLINPGCDMDDYDVQLACVTRNEMDKYPGIDCTVQNDPMGSNCDCINLDHEKPYYFYDGARLKQSELEDKDKHDVISSPYRYDHYKFTLRTDRDVVGELKSRC